MTVNDILPFHLDRMPDLFAHAFRIPFSFVRSPASAVATVQIATDISMVTATLKASICKSVSSTLAIDFARCAIAGARAGSSVVDISIAPDASQPSVAPTALAAAIVTQASNPSSPLVQSMQAAAPVVTSFAATSSAAAAYQCQDGSWQSSSLWYVNCKTSRLLLRV
jgi:hypothetical protein